MIALTAIQSKSDPNAWAACCDSCKDRIEAWSRDWAPPLYHACDKPIKASAFACDRQRGHSGPCCCCSVPTANTAQKCLLIGRHGSAIQGNKEPS